jgi:FkbM family methyltransferase
MKSKLARYRGWARSAAAPRARLLPGLGVRLAARPAVAEAVFNALRMLPGRALRQLATKYVARPLVTRMDAKLEVRTDGDFVIRVETSEPMGRVLAASGRWEPHVTAAFQALLEPGDVCVDVGANIGYNALLAAQLVGPEGHVYALEPSAQTHEWLLENLQLNGTSNVTALRVAAGAADGEILLRDRPEGQSVRSAVGGIDESLPAESLVSVPVQTVASLIQPSEAARLRLVKIDVEGFELEVLRGARPVFDSGGRPAVIAELHRGHVDETVSFLLELGHECGLTLYKLVNDDAPPRRRAQNDGLPGWIDYPVAPGSARLPNGVHVILASTSIVEQAG